MASLSVKYGKDTVQLDFSLERTIAELQSLLEERTGLMVRKQKLMAAGKVLSGRGGSLAAAGVKPGAKLMLLAAAGSATSGQAALEASRAGKQEALERGRAALAAKAQQKGISLASAGGGGGGASSSTSTASMQQRAETWQKTGIASLRDLKLEQLPSELFSVAAGVRVLDAGGNRLSMLPPAISSLSALQRLRLSLNQLTDEGAAWPALAALTQLAILALDDNRLTALPPCVSALARLQKLSLNGNQIGGWQAAGVTADWFDKECSQALRHRLLPGSRSSLPDSIGTLQQLRALALRGNRLAQLPASLGSCAQLVELDARDNQLAVLPVELGQLTSLKLLLLDNNRLKTVPPVILTGCSSLATLSLHGNPITVEQLRETPGFQQFDERRRAKYDKQVNSRVLITGFDEGADIHEFEHWND